MLISLAQAIAIVVLLVIVVILVVVIVEVTRRNCRALLSAIVLLNLKEKL